MATITSTPRDGDEQKRFPNGIRVLAHALWQFWPVVAEGYEGSSKPLNKYLKTDKLFHIARTLRESYPKVSFRDSGPHEVLGKLGRNEQDLTYMHIRLMAEWCEIPAGLLLLFAHLISVERAASKKEYDDAVQVDLTYLLDKIDAFTNEVRSLIAEKQGDSDIFLRRYTTKDTNKEEFLADIGALHRLATAVAAVTRKEIT